MIIVRYLTLFLLFNLQIVILLAQVDKEQSLVLRVPKEGVLLGQELPSAFWNQTLTSYNEKGVPKKIVLNDFKEKFLVLDFWATYCSPCVASLDKWNKWQYEFGDKVQVLAIHLYDYNHKALPFANKRGWSIPLVYGNAQDTTINQLFYYDRSYGQIWIKDGKLFAIPISWEVGIEDIRRAVLKGIPPPKQNTFLTYDELKSQSIL